MNNQEIFDTIVDHLYKQQVASVNIYGQCQYRGENGTSCAVGCLIKDEFYNEDYEGDGASDSTVVKMVEKSLGQNLSNDMVYLLRSLQNIHDTYMTSPAGYSRLVEEQLLFVANELNLTFKSRLNN